MAEKLIWRVSEASTGPYRSFIRRSWPSATGADGSVRFHLTCDDEYVPRNVREGNHGPITIRVAMKNPPELRDQKGGFSWRTLKARASTLKEAKTICQQFVDSHPDWPFPGA